MKYQIAFILSVILSVNIMAQSTLPSKNALEIPMKEDQVSILFDPQNSVFFDESSIRGTGNDLTISLGDIDFGKSQYKKLWVEMTCLGNMTDESVFEFYLDDELKQPKAELTIPLNISNGSYESTKIPNSGIFFKNKQADKIYAFDLRGQSNISKIICSAAQGIINQQTAQVYLIYEDHDIDQIKGTGIDYEIVENYNNAAFGALGAMINKYGYVFQKMIVWDEVKEWTWCIAQMMGAQQRGLPVTEEVRNFLLNDLRWNIAVKDIRNQWKNRLDAYQWAIDNLSKDCHQKLSFSAGLREDYKNNPWRIYDYATASKGFVFWLDNSKKEESDMLEKILSAMDYQPGSSTMGYGYGSDGDGLNNIINKHNTGFMVSDYYGNGSFWCSFKNKSFNQRKGQAIEALPGKIYVSIIWSDGDNIQFDANQMYRMFKYGKRRGEVPTGVTMATVLQEVNPTLLEFFYKNQTNQDELLAGPSGFQFIYGDVYNAANYDAWLEMNRKWVETGGFNTVCLWNTENTDRFERYMETCNLQGIFDGWSRNQYKYKNGVVVVNQGAHCWKEGDVYDDLKKANANYQKPVFRNVYLITANYGGTDGYERLIRELEKLEVERPNTYVYMLPKDLCATLAKYLDKHNGKY